MTGSIGEGMEKVFLPSEEHQQNAVKAPGTKEDDERVEPRLKAVDKPKAKTMPSRTKAFSRLNASDSRAAQVR
jgi:hypothetical protein